MLLPVQTFVLFVLLLVQNAVLLYVLFLGQVVVLLFVLLLVQHLAHSQSNLGQKTVEVRQFLCLEFYLSRQLALLEWWGGSGGGWGARGGGGVRLCRGWGGLVVGVVGMVVRVGGG